LGAHGRHLTHRGDPPLLTNLNDRGERVLSAHQTRNELLEPARRLRGAIPDVIGAYLWGTRAAAAHREFSAEETNAAWAARR
jgi:hypothetical protein